MLIYMIYCDVRSIGLRALPFLSFQIVKDHHLFAVVFLLVLVDVTYLTVWQVLDPMRRTLYNSKTEVKKNIHDGKETFDMC